MFEERNRNSASTICIRGETNPFTDHDVKELFHDFSKPYVSIQKHGSQSDAWLVSFEQENDAKSALSYLSEKFRKRFDAPPSPLQHNRFEKTRSRTTNSYFKKAEFYERENFGSSYPSNQFQQNVFIENQIVKKNEEENPSKNCIYPKSLGKKKNSKNNLHMSAEFHQQSHQLQRHFLTQSPFSSHPVYKQSHNLKIETDLTLVENPSSLTPSTSHNGIQSPAQMEEINSEQGRNRNRWTSQKKLGDFQKPRSVTDSFVKTMQAYYTEKSDSYQENFVSYSPSTFLQILKEIQPIEAPDTMKDPRLYVALTNPIPPQEILDHHPKELQDQACPLEGEKISSRKCGSRSKNRSRGRKHSRSLCTSAENSGETIVAGQFLSSNSTPLSLDSTSLASTSGPLLLPQDSISLNSNSAPLSPFFSPLSEVSSFGSFNSHSPNVPLTPPLSPSVERLTQNFEKLYTATHRKRLLKKIQNSSM